MDYISFYTENREYIVEIYKIKKFFSYSEFGKYECHIRFKDYIGNIVLDIPCVEKQLVSFMDSLFDFNMNYGNILSDIIHFEQSNYFVYLSSSEEIPDYPVEEDPVVYFQFFESSIYGNASRLFISMSFCALEDFIMNIFKVVEDIPYLHDMQFSTMLDFIGEN